MFQALAQRTQSGGRCYRGNGEEGLEKFTFSLTTADNCEGKSQEDEEEKDRDEETEDEDEESYSAKGRS